MNVTVPNVVGQPLASASAIAQKSGLNIAPNFNGGTVRTQSPAAGSTVATGGSLTLTMNVTVPNTVGATMPTAIQRLEGAGLRPQFSGINPGSCVVIAQTPLGGAVVPTGTIVFLTHLIFC